MTLVNSRSDIAERQATHAEYSGMVLFRNVFDGELPAVEYPKINVSPHPLVKLFVRYTTPEPRLTLGSSTWR